MSRSRLQLDYQHRQQLLLRVYRIALTGFAAAFLLSLFLFDLDVRLALGLATLTLSLGERLTAHGRVRQAAWILLLTGATSVFLLPLFGEAGNDSALFMMAPLMIVAGLFLQPRAYWIFALLLAVELLFVCMAEAQQWVKPWYGSSRQIYIWPEFAVTLLAHGITCLLINVIISGVGFFYITEQHRLAEQSAVWHRAAITDALTGLYNRRGFVEHAQRLFKRAQLNKQGIAVLMIDIDYFKTINDGFGHDAGDRVIQLLAQHLMNDFRSSDLVGRMGGEEFCVLLTNIDLQQALQRAERLRQNVSAQPYHSNEGIIPYTISIGVSTAMDQDLDSLIKLADNALYRAKNQGRNCVVVSESALVDST